MGGSLYQPETVGQWSCAESIRRFRPWWAHGLFLVTVGILLTRTPPVRAQTGTQSPTSAVMDPETGLVHSRRLASGVPLGGIGAGTFELRTDGTFSHATITNNWNQPTGDLPGCFAALWTRSSGAGSARVLALRNAYGLPTVAGLDYEGLYPKASLVFTDPAVPVVATLNAFSPLTPGDLANSSYPAAVFVLRFRNRLATSVDVSIALSWENILGVGGSAWSGPFHNRTGDRVETLPSAEGYFGLRFSGPIGQSETPTADRLRDNASGDMTLLALPPRPLAVVTTAGWNTLDRRPSWWDQFAATGDVSGESAPGREGIVHPAGVVAVRVTLKPNEFIELPFAVSWNTPYAFTRAGIDEGHYYQNIFPDSNASARRILSEWRSLLALTEEWQNRLLFSNLPHWLARRLINCATPLTTHTIHTRDGRFAVLNATRISPEATAEEASRLGTFASLPNRLVSGTALLSFFPQLYVQELREYASLQTADGWLPPLGDSTAGLPNPTPVGIAGAPDAPARSNGRALEVSPPVSGGASAGVTGVTLPSITTPTMADVDAVSAFTLQVAFYNAWTGDGPFLVRRFRHVRRALEAVLKRCSPDGLPDLPSGPPEDASLFVGTARSGLSPASAILWLAALQSGRLLAEEAAERTLVISATPEDPHSDDEPVVSFIDGVLERRADRDFAQRCGAVAALAGDSIEHRFWNGRGYAPTDKASSVSLDALAGVWASQLIGQDLPLSPSHIALALQAASAEALKLPLVVAPGVGLPTAANAAARLPVLTLAVGALDIRAGSPETGLALLEKLDAFRNEVRLSPWAEALTMGPEGGTQSVTSVADWNIPLALQGFALDLNTGRLSLTPHLPGPWRSLRAPLFAPSFWGRMEFKPLAHGYVLTVSVDRIIPYAGRPNLRTRNSAVFTLATLRVPGAPAGTTATGMPVAHVSRGRNALGGRLTREVNGDLSFALDTPLTLQAGDRLEIELDE